ncbi:MAG: ABC transporter ATP-binding protein [Clostridia bacterium]|nr:ABC transporter ATP-binding protein [Clostridia bacterium]
MSAPVIVLQNAVYKYPKGSFSLNCPALQLFAGELALILGPNGSGKTTLSKLACGIYKPDSGQLLLNGESANGFSLGKIGKTVGYLFQEPGRQLFATNCLEELTFVGEIKGANKEQTAARAEDLLKRFGLFELRERSIYRLSRGEKQRLALCGILMQNPLYIILDEPTTGLDKQARQVLYNTIDELLSQGVGLAVISHDHEVIDRYTQAKIIKVANGEVLA